MIFPVQTFTSQRLNNYDIAINYYRQRSHILISNLNEKLKRKFFNQLQSIPNIDELFDQTFNNYRQNFQPIWENIYSAKYDSTTLAQALQNWNTAVTQLGTTIDNNQKTLLLLQYLNGNKPVTNLDLSSTQGIDFSKVEKIQSNLMDQNYAEGASFRGARAKYFGEIFEQLAGLVLQNSLSDVFSVLQLGDERSLNPLGNKVQGKSDYGLLGFNGYIADTNVFGKVLAERGTDELVLLEALQGIDLEQKNINDIIETYTAGNDGLFGGVSMKQWTDSVLNQSAYISGGSFGSFQLSADFVNQRLPKGISKEFSNRKVFEEYTAYAISRFLLNIIGIHNIIIASGSDIMYTHDWLDNVRNSLKLVHNIEAIDTDRYWAYASIKLIKI